MLRYLPGSTHELDIADISWAGPNVAVADGEAISSLKDPTSGDPLPPLTATFRSVSIKEHGQWLIAHLVPMPSCSRARRIDALQVLAGTGQSCARCRWTTSF